ncbi:hypothetical protein PM10SUCC1_24060 [Propionigenium maris DSM 9537]|uniref:Uncharacterized protein n=1 Tax=Propionigenium maris DSM 9537 TaxID=1123000 RepID=A0A9W6GNP0_9FUSO|nr:hypothetical protein [Propionigenium maris]GLI56892.1 hypothetical protein PM10SUCC1_24060 [Propionigenium maris DSM 9537]
MILTRANYIMSVGSSGGISDGMRFVAIFFMLAFLIDFLMLLVCEEGSRKMPVKSYISYMVMYFIYRISLI